MKLEFVENETSIISGSQLNALHDILDISDEIKKELGLRFSPVVLTGNSIRFNGIIANIKYNDTELVVRPKITKAETTPVAYDGFLRTLYLRILKSCKSDLRSIVYFTSMATEDTDDHTFIDCIAQYFLDRLAYAMKKLPIVVYYQKEEKRSAVKGKILIQKELQDPVRDGKTWCRYKVLSQDNTYNALLKWCGMYLAANVSSKALKLKLERQVSMLEGNPSSLSPTVVKAMRLPRNFEAYRESFSIARDMFLYNNQNTKVRHNSKHICGYVVNMEAAFENIVSYYVERYSLRKDLLHTAQADIRLATEAQCGSSFEFHVRPDDLIVKNKRKLILDAKYKYIAAFDKPVRDDFYQMVASCIAHQTMEAILIYPAISSTDSYSKAWTLDQTINDSELKVYAGKIDIFADDTTIIGQIESAIMKSAFSEVVSG